MYNMYMYIYVHKIHMKIGSLFIQYIYSHVDNCIRSTKEGI